MKKAFTLMELIIVILIIGLVYSLIISSNNFNSKEYKEKLNLFNIKSHLLRNYEFKKRINFFCIKKDLSCYIKIDDDILDDVIIKDFFKKIPYVYEYRNDYTRIEFSPIKLVNNEEEVVFELVINDDFKSRDFVVEKDEKFYLFNSIYETPIEYNSFNDIFSEIDSNIQEIKNAF